MLLTPSRYILYSAQDEIENLFVALRDLLVAPKGSSASNRYTAPPKQTAPLNWGRQQPRSAKSNLLLRRVRAALSADLPAFVSPLGPTDHKAVLEAALVSKASLDCVACRGSISSSTTP